MNKLNLFALEAKSALNEVRDLLLVAHGYEARAISIAKLAYGNSNRCLALGFDHNRNLSYCDNEQWFRSAGFELRPDLSAKEFSAEIPLILRDAYYSKRSAAFRLAVDISCFDRYRLAIIVEQIEKFGEIAPIDVDFFYSIGAFQLPSSANGRNEFAGPVHPGFAGRFVDPGWPLAMIAGLGYEIGKVVGAVEYLQASRVITFFPESPVVGYKPEVAKANKLLIDDVAQGDLIHYPVDDCRKTLATLDSVVRGLRNSHNIVLLPGGPKMFGLICLLTQRVHRQCSVWRVSSGSSISPRNIESSGRIVGLRWRLAPLPVLPSAD